MTGRAAVRVAGPTTAGSTVVMGRACACGEHSNGIGRCDSCRQHGGLIQRCPENGNPGCACGAEEALRTPGIPLDPAVRREMEHRFGADFSRVRVHTDAASAAGAHRLNAAAFTVGSDIVFAAGRFAPHAGDGRRLLAHELAHVIQQRGMPAVGGRLTIGAADDHHERAAATAATGPAGATAGPVVAPGRIQRQPTGGQQPPPNPRAVCVRPGLPAPAPATCWAKEPEQCATFGAWLSSFDPLRTFTTEEVIAGSASTPFGAEPAARDPRDVRTQRPGETAPGTRPGTPIPHPTDADRFIDHPTDDWVQTCLPPELRATAYMLPSDCADIAVILWHVWLFAHGRSAQFGPWTCGVRAGTGRRGGVGPVIGEVYSQNIARMLQPYADVHGNPLRSFAALRDRMHAGDVLVWRHSGAGAGAPGHTQTVVDLEYQSGAVTAIDVVQGNMPLDQAQAIAIRARLTSEGRKAKSLPSEESLRSAPGRRLELDRLSGSSLQDGPDPAATDPSRAATVWLLSGDTGLVAAGPPRTAARPAGGGPLRTRRLVDWAAPLRSATGANDLLAGFEEALHEVRALVDSGGSDDDGARDIGEAAGDSLWRLARRARDTADESHFGRLRRMQAVLVSMRDDQTDHPRHAELFRVFTLVNESFTEAARGIAGVRFPASAPKGKRLVRVLVTGFDPFMPTRIGGGLVPGAWNPSAAAALALDGEQIDAGGKVVAAVEAMILPVDFGEFNRGLVEAAVGRHLDRVDAVLTVSMAGGEAREGVMRFERFAVGIHDVPPGTPGMPSGLQDVPAAPGTTVAGRPVIESTGSVDTLRTEISKGAITAEIGDEITLRLPSAAAANDVRQALRLPPGTGQEVEITDLGALRQIAASAARGSHPAEITFTDPAGKRRVATLVSGPGGDFLSNEVSYRVLRMIESRPAGARPISFHTHVPQGLLDNPPSAKAAAARSSRVRSNVITALRRTIAATARSIAQQRGSGGTGP